MFIDTHCHFDFPPFRDDEQQSLQRAAQVGVEKIIVPAVSGHNLQRVFKLACSYPEVYAGLGLHPLYINEHQESHLADLERLLKQKHEKLVAVGEIGLDLYMAEPQFAKQEELLCAQLRLAKQYELPVMLHSRKSHDQLAAILRRINLPRTGVVHGFAGSLSQAEAFIRLGYYIGVGGTMTYERAQKTRRAVAELPLTFLVLETDAPDMPLFGFQGEPNRPERITGVFASLCELRRESPDEIAAQLYHNSIELFGLVI
ncbi:TatD family hydrolase [Photorhabdus heterorhabditis]|uniref:Deoxyribonuclease YjjV n=1 Tax=Photorhabdus heterorhabditis TaxID=880156 RepID=A0A5B0WTP8_9GAMM|nr:TatD family hydrolase [Photorhabdus heterorhabditis]KAA1189807.1 YchF/TatD family DNA exonuclease [Photorhabdus heterorhabditis]KOY63871.1 deoxyribonuclease YjjV [Photorhabdus heterorhabditis]MBS9442053.1 YchF/TatD family DNA exonuclease [Photorhabdus heterorhabditis]